jgi:hypothetical protein
MVIYTKQLFSLKEKSIIMNREPLYPKQLSLSNRLKKKLSLDHLFIWRPMVKNKAKLDR